MSTGIARTILAIVLSSPLLLALVHPAAAEGPATLELQAPKEVRLGDEVSVTATLRDGNGAPIPGATIILWSPGEFLSVSDAVELGRAATNVQGHVTFRYEARSGGAVSLNASFAGDARNAPAQAAAPLQVQGSAQLTHHPREGVRVPGVSVWILVGILGGVWSTYFSVAVLLTLIAREGPKGGAYGPGGRYG